MVILVVSRKDLHRPRRVNGHSTGKGDLKSQMFYRKVYNIKSNWNFQKFLRLKPKIPLTEGYGIMDFFETWHGKFLLNST